MLLRRFCVVNKSCLWQISKLRLLQPSLAHVLDTFFLGCMLVFGVKECTLLSIRNEEWNVLKLYIPLKNETETLSIWLCNFRVTIGKLTTRFFGIFFSSIPSVQFYLFYFEEGNRNRSAEYLTRRLWLFYDSWWCIFLHSTDVAMVMLSLVWLGLMQWVLACDTLQTSIY